MPLVVFLRDVFEINIKAFEFMLMRAVYRTGNIYAPGGDAASNADTTMSGTLVSGTLASGMTPFCGVPVSGTRSARGRGPSPDSDSAAMMGIIHTRVPRPAASEAGSEALERITALENQVSSLGAKVMEMLVRLDEVSSCVSASSTPQRQATVGASPTTSNITFEDLQAQNLQDAATPSPANVTTAAHLATREWVEGPKTPEVPGASSPMQVSTQEWVEGPKTPEVPDASSPMQVSIQGCVEGPKERVEESKMSPMPEHTVEHPEGYKPVNCSCARPRAQGNDMVMPTEVDPFSVDEIASRGNVF